MKKICMMVMFLFLLCATCTASFSPPKMKIGDVDGQWTYIGRYRAQVGDNKTLKELILFSQPYNEQTETEGVFDVYYYHVHNSSANEEGAGCKRHKIEQTGETYHSLYNCILKLVQLDKTGKPIRKSGDDGATMVVSVIAYQGAQGLRFKILHYRTYETMSNKLILDADARNNQKLEEILNRGIAYYFLYEQEMFKKYGKDAYRDKIKSNMFWRAASVSNCPLTPPPPPPDQG